MKIDVIIPIYKPDKKFFDLLDLLAIQSADIGKIILMNTEKKFFDRALKGRHLEDFGSNISVCHISKREFDHGRTRNLGVRCSEAEIFVCMTQDAVPYGRDLIEKLTEPLIKNEKIAAAYARQLPGKESSVLERFARFYNYPPGSLEKSEEDRERMGIKTYFFSNVCAAYRRDVFDRLGGFADRAIFNEDMLFCAKALKAGYKVYYSAEAKVVHSHNYSCMQQFKRNFDIGVSQAMHPEVFSGIRSEKEGTKMVKKAVCYLWKKSKAGQIPGFFLQCAAKYAGFWLGKHYRLLPGKVILACTSNREFWKNHSLERE